MTSERRYLEGLNPQQREAVLHEGSPLLILAGAGSGKTRVITAKIAHLIDRKGYDPRSILAVTFTNKAAGEMLKRASEMVDGAAAVMIRTFHSFGAWLLRRYGDSIGMHPDFTIYDDDDTVSLLQAVREGSPRRELARYAHWISRAKDYCIRPEGDLLSISADPHLGEIYSLYEERLRRIGNADFGDLILKTADLLAANPQVRAKIHGRFRAILVDEYQDSNVAQYELLKLLVGPDCYLCVVGDDDQSIYRFRGAEVRNILSFSESFPGTMVIRLEENYRSTRTILDIASAVVANNKGRLGKRLWTEKEEGSRAILAYLEDHQEEAEFCARLLADGNLRNTAILYRTNAQSLAFETLFARRGIPYRLVGALRFYEREEIKDALALLSLVANPRDEVAFRRVVNKPARGIGKASVDRIAALGAQGSGDLVTASRAALDHLSKRASEGLSDFILLVDALSRDLDTVPLSQFVKRAVTDSGLLDLHRLQDAVAGSQKVRNLDELVNAAVPYGSGREGLALFLEHIELDRSQVAGEDDESGDSVTLITMHNTKGLEFDRVIITGLEDELFPGRREELEDDLEEERRLFYVSITRARRELYLICCRTRLVWGRITQMHPSQFLTEIPKELLSVQGGVEEEGEDGYEPGSAVYHDDYGAGVVERKWYNGRELMVQVTFESGRKLQFIPRYTPLERISRDG